jgi:uncharacterized protein YrrD
MELAASTLIDKAVITFDTGRRLAHVEDLLVDPERNQILALLIDRGAVFVAPKAIPFGHIKSIGENAIVVPQRNVVYDARKDPDLRRTFDHRTIKGMRVYSEKGDRLGVISDMIIDDHTGEIYYYEVSGGAIGDAMRGKRTIVPGEVLNMGRLVLYVSEATATRLESQQGGMAGALEQARQRVNQLSDQTADRANQGLTRLTDQVSQQQQAYIVGRTALRPVAGKDGQPLVQEGETITEDTVAQAREQGRLPALLMAGGMGEAQQHLGTLGQQANESFSQIRVEARQLWDQLMHHTNRISDQTDSRIEQERIDRALGRPTTRVIFDRQDTIILNTGEIITNAAVRQAREAGVLHILLDSVYTERPRLGLADLKAPWSGSASLDEEPPLAQGPSPGSQPLAGAPPEPPLVPDPLSPPPTVPASQPERLTR